MLLICYRGWNFNGVRNSWRNRNQQKTENLHIYGGKVIREYFETYRNSAEEFRQERGGGGKQIITGRRCGMGGKV